MLSVIQNDPRGARLERALRQRIKGEVRFDAHSRLLYSTGARMPSGSRTPRNSVKPK